MRILFLLSALIVLGCENSERPTALSYRVKHEGLDVSIPVHGELEAVTETPIAVPSDVNEPQTLAWLAEENTVVKTGDVVARLDAVKYEREVESQQLKQEQVEQALTSKHVVMSNEKRDILDELLLVDREQKLAQKFAVEDLRVYSRNDIIDKLANVEYLGARRDYQQWRQGRQEKKAKGEIELLQLEKQQAQTKLDLAHKVLNRLEIKAPHDGIFVMVKNWNGRKPSVGETMWPGRKFAVIPRLDVMQAKVSVLESEAFGLKEGLAVSLLLDAEPKVKLEGRLTTVDGVASAREENNPVKYFGVTVQLNNAPPNLSPGAQVHGHIRVLQKPNCIAIPAQAVQLVGDENFIWVDNHGRIEKRLIKIGWRSLTRVEIVDGLAVGESVLLQPPEEIGS